MSAGDDTLRYVQNFAWNRSVGLCSMCRNGVWLFASAIFIGKRVAAAGSRHPSIDTYTCLLEQLHGYDGVAANSTSTRAAKMRLLDWFTQPWDLFSQCETVEWFCTRSPFACIFSIFDFLHRQTMHFCWQQVFDHFTWRTGAKRYTPAFTTSPYPIHRTTVPWMRCTFRSQP